MASKWWQVSAEACRKWRSSWQCIHHSAAPQDAAIRKFIQSSWLGFPTSLDPHKLLQMFTSLVSLDAFELTASTSHYKGKYCIFNYMFK